ncbi:uncharacterized protein LOC124490472 [Dermatophagoides farinae]|uniref:Uncharacterized protein n=1 Tax=Dermatophagoides farinae TaxID=6954 RepID=A0A922HMB3_DERFA|nr:uncharacterized protein LOC124490472 [Dermatophagoides farinae]KAH7645566.1 hypothetical protein HUG17_1104 [Dermatophagoides farinae]KAH9497544.1 hypothetical protein DERF_013523 [Dermatophagoides farinae]
MKLTLAFVLAIFVVTSSAMLFRTKVTPDRIVVKSPVKNTRLRNIVPVQPIQQVQNPIQTVIRQPFQPIRSFSEPLNVPVISSHDIQFIPVTVEAPIQQSQVIAVEPSSQAVHLVFKSVSSPVSIHQQHSPGERSFYETTRSEEPPHVIRHEVFKPVVQELRETIQPYRQVTQEIRPVIEKINVLVPKGQQTNKQLSGDHVNRDWILPIPPILPKLPDLPSIIKPIFSKPVVQLPEEQRFPVQQQEVPIVQIHEPDSNIQIAHERYTVPIIVEHTQQQRMEETNEENFD